MYRGRRTADDPCGGGAAGARAAVLRRCTTAPLRRRPFRLHAAAAALLLLLLASPALAADPRPYLLVEQVPGHSQLQLAEEGLAVLRSVAGPIAPVVVIGPYRSGKSFLLNQLLGVSCGTGFGVGHTRDTQTKGIWLWGQPFEAPDDTGVNRTIIYVDTEGFESTARSSSYDDRIFAVAAVMSSLLVYNLPETIRESDVSKLSFAVDLASGFYDQWNGSAGEPLQLGRMLWVIQRDFLQGKGVQQLVDEALSPVPNPAKDKELEQLNRIRTSLAAIAGNSTGYSLPQPHLDRTRLCDLADSDLDPRYLKQRDGLRGVVARLARHKVLGTEAFDGSALAGLLSDLIKALNEKEVPTGASLLESFNQQLVGRAVAAYTKVLDAIEVPLDAKELGKQLEAAHAAALGIFEQQLLGRRQGSALRVQLLAAFDRERRSKELANTAASNEVCQKHEMVCTRALDALGRMALPSMRTFEGSFHRCKVEFESKCVGPARAASAERLALAWGRARSQFGADYNGRMLTGLVALAVAVIVVFRFLAPARTLEIAGWAALAFLELYPRLYQNTMYDTTWWRATTQAWELLMRLAFGDWAPFTWILTAAALYLNWRRRRRVNGAARRPSGPALGGGGSGGGGKGGAAWAANGGGGGGGGGSVAVGIGGGGGGSSGSGPPGWRGLLWGTAARKKGARRPDPLRDLDV